MRIWSILLIKSDLNGVYIWVEVSFCISALTAVKDHVMKYSETAFSNSNVNYFWSIKNSSEVIEKLLLRNF